MKKKILFVCIENSNRSQMSQAFAKILGGANVEAYSAGSKPSGIVNPKAIAAMKVCIPDREIHAIDCNSIILQHGSLHCITMQFPEGIIE